LRIEAKFVKSASQLSEVPELGIPEIAIMGRSNVGKSSTINSLTNRKSLAKSSNTPGKTKLINYFQISFEKDSFALVDLPGVGYAKVSKSQKIEWERKLGEFIQKREEISLFIYLIDSRHPNLEIDAGVLAYLESLDKKVLAVYTKTDKLKKNELNRLKMKNQNSIFLSNLKRDGISELRERILNEI
jgi:GTP-binding protein